MGITNDYNAMKLYTEEEVKKYCKRAIWDYIHVSDDLKGTDFHGGISVSFKQACKTNIDAWWKIIKNKI
jgi:hypothetical protein